MPDFDQAKPLKNVTINSMIDTIVKGIDLMSKRLFLLNIFLIVFLVSGAMLTRAQSSDSIELPEKAHSDVNIAISPGNISGVQDAHSRVYSVNPGGFLYDSDSTGIVMGIDFGLIWAPGNEEAGFYMRRPADWDGQTPVVVTITFALGGNEAGTVNWRLKLNTYTPGSGEWLTNPASRNADEILTFPDGPSWYRIYSQTFTIPAGDFHEEPYWSFFFLRGDGTNGETFTGNLYVMGADVAYTASP